MTTTLALTFDVTARSEDALQGFMMLNAEVLGIEQTAAGQTIFYLPESTGMDNLLHRLDHFLSREKEVTATLVSTEAIQERNWNTEWEASVQPLKLSDELTITPSWHLEQARTLGTKHLLIIDPKMSFGTGHHETTRLCLQALKGTPLKGHSVLDLGTGSGILAMYALQLGARSALGVDNDEWSILNAEENRIRNGFTTEQFEVRRGTLENVERQQFDVIVANIHRNILLSISGDLAQRTAHDGYVILSGLLKYDGSEVIQHYASAGLILREQLQENEWIALVLQKSK